MATTARPSRMASYSRGLNSQCLNSRFFHRGLATCTPTIFSEHTLTKFRLSDWANVAEIGAAVGVIISLIFVGLQLQSNTDATEAATREAINQKDMEFLSLRIDSSVLARAYAKLENGEELSLLEKSQLGHQEYVNFISFEHSLYQYRKGVLEPKEWLPHWNIVQSQIEDFLYTRTMWESKRNTFTPEFQELVDSFAAD